MASTLTLQATCNWSKAFLEQQPLIINGLEPALGSANLILQTILGPPFTWPWNRGSLSFNSATQDTTVSGLSSFGFLEGGTVAGEDNKPWAVAVRNFLESDASGARPQFCSPLIDDGQGNITFRLSPSPEGTAYSAILLYQKKAPLMNSLASMWGPVPDERNYICQWGFLAMMSLIGNDARFGEYNTKFIVGLLGAQGGLTDMERNIFLANWTRVLSQLQATQLATAERYKARES